MEKFIVYTDGGARGNPGPAALGVVIQNSRGQVLKEYGEYLGGATNNEAEYRAPIFALRKIKALWGKEKAKKAEVQVFADSELLVNQLNGKYKIENRNIQNLFLELWNLKIDFGKVAFTAIPREKNKEADRLVNEALDAKGYTKQLL
ncbi:MAG: hypothetical protein A3D64_00965 [Candidatus Wildermuthbacteria bacterium RIFCSPHIGHO2_02_FULL_49_9]|uniref:RNase H type-1 domain-containing protein n=2 Tax=Candidatus Wildermuthiibacteriota TaxID=1817923 RepID=A0A1G2QXH4_9BACT|nr:MAG: hypothetical protein A2672_03090 [Candidatus Wildermuthbacteria bacterium RIFCSPHIGHO2_01_FULL_49_22b]OHA70227.1 MAG: hypothetical protein A3D64_00965 [Candidatus Wildermuthbacteria bacterium RIFCSPHIGHO2_02_FULL_49_9]